MYSIEPLNGQALLIRFGSDHTQYGDPYEGTAVVEIIEDVATIKGLNKMPPKSEIKILFAELKDKYKISKIIWERIKPNGVKNVVKS